MPISSAHSHRSLWIAAIGACLLIVAIPIVLWRAHPHADDEQLWERQHQLELVQLKSEAEALAIAGKLPEAHAKYRAIQQIVSGHDIKDPLIWDMLEQCKTDQDRIYTVLLLKMERSVMPAAPAPTEPLDPRPIPPYPSEYNALASPTTREGEVLSPSPGTPGEGRGEGSARPTPRGPVVSPTTKRLSRIPTPEGISDEQIAAAIQRGVDFLLGNFQGDELKQLGGMASPTGHHGLNALAVYALLQASQSIRDDRININSPAIQAKIEAMKRHRLEPAEGTQAPVVYARAIRAAALSVFNRPQDHAALKADVDWLTKAQVGGAYSYDDTFVKMFSRARFTDEPLDIRNILAHGKHNPDGSEGEQPSVLPWSRSGAGPIRLPWKRTDPGPTSLPWSQTDSGQTAIELNYPWDNSNSQLAVFGVECGANCDIDVPSKYWQSVASHWVASQTDDGQWFYSAVETRPTLAMSLGGITSLFVVHDQLDVDSPKAKQALGTLPATIITTVRKGLEHLEAGDNSVQMLTPDTYYVSYDLFGLERVSRATGFKYFGSHDWYRELAGRVVPVQWKNGAFGRTPEGFDAVAETAFTVLFLTRGRAPVLMNKLRFDGAWANRPHDLDHLSRFASRELERPINWQVVPVSRKFTDWMDSPVLYIASNAPMNLTEADLENLRNFVRAGGMIFTQADNSNAMFNAYVDNTLAPTLFPHYPLRAVEEDDLIYSCQYRIKSPPPRLKGIWNGSRWLLVHSPTDLSSIWQSRSAKSAPPVFELPINLFIYAAGQNDLRNRLASPQIPEPSVAPANSVSIARLGYDGNCDPEPFAWQRFKRWIAWEGDVDLQISNVEMRDLKPRAANIAVLTGTGEFSPADDEIAALRNFVDAGGTLLIDCCGGSADFARSIETVLLPKLAPGAHVDPLPATDPILAGGGDLDDLTHPALRPDTRERLGDGVAQLRGITLGKGRILYSPIDITSGLLGIHTLGILGYQSDAACELVRNVILVGQKRQ